MLKIGFDLDGVLADWAFGFCRTARVMGLGIPQLSFRNWSGYSAEKAYLTNEQISRVWKVIKNEPRWWAHLPTMPDLRVEDVHRIKKLTQRHDVFFITHRMSDVSPSSMQSALWLKWNFGIEFPNVIVGRRKGDIARAIDLDYMIEDKIENAWCVHWISEERCKSYLIDRPYNQHAPEPFIGSKSVRRVNSISEYLDDIEAGV